MTEPCYSADWRPMYLAERNIPIRRALCHDGTLITGGGSDRIRSRVIKHLREIGFRPANFQKYFETAVCHAMPPGSRACKFVDDDAPAEIRAERTLSLHDVFHFLGTAKRWLEGGMTLVSEEKAQQRAAVCRQCPYNGQVGGCTGCSNFASKVAAVVGGRKIAGLGDLDSCQICACNLKALVFMPLETLGDATEEPAWCWKKTEQG
jgi:hypothetical protein